jgi:hypothetical protein
MKARVICRLPKAGLGNQLFPLMHAFLFAKLNGLTVTVIGYHQLKLGPYLRGERVKRKYLGYFTFEKSLVGEWADRLSCRMSLRHGMVVQEPEVVAMREDDLKGKIFVFEKLPTYHDYFKHLRDHRDEVRDILYSLLKGDIVSQLNRFQNPVMGVHIRMGDFRKLKEGEAFRGGHVRTPLQYFTDIVSGLRKLAGKDLPVTLFSDGYPDELKEVTGLPQVNMQGGSPDIVDLLLLSRSRVIVATTGSTFSYWAAFLSDAEVILHPDHIYAPFRPTYLTNEHYEGPFMAGIPVPVLLKKNLQAI